MCIPKPSTEEVEKYLKEWDNLDEGKYYAQEEALNKLFFELCPYNKDINSILIKAATLNNFYSTNVYYIYDVAKHIESLNIDERLNALDINLIDDIKKVEIKGRGIVMNFYSFATKYCSHHKPCNYPIYDKYVDAVIRYFRDKHNFYNFKNEDLKEYGKFKNIIFEFIKFYKLDKYCFKQIDMYLWQLGKKLQSISKK